MYCNDLKQLCDAMGNPILPAQLEGKHNALEDARWVKQAFEFLQNKKQDRLKALDEKVNETVQPINRNWTNEDGTHNGGVSTGIGFTISWQRGAVHIPDDSGERNENGRNGAFLLEVLDACRNQLEYFQDTYNPSEENEKALASLKECIGYLNARLERRKLEGTLGTHDLEKS